MEPSDKELKKIADIKQEKPINVEKTVQGELLLDPWKDFKRKLANKSWPIYFNRKIIGFWSQDYASDRKNVASLMEENEYGELVKTDTYKISVKQTELSPVFSLYINDMLVSRDTIEFFIFDQNQIKNLSSLLGQDVVKLYQDQKEKIKNVVDKTLEVLKKKEEERTEEVEDQSNLPEIVKKHREEKKKPGIPKNELWYLSQIKDKAFLEELLTRQLAPEIKKAAQDRLGQLNSVSQSALASLKDVEAMSRGAIKVAEKICRSLHGNFERNMGRFRYDKNNQSCLICLKTPIRNKKMYFVISLFSDGCIAYRPYARGSAKEYDMLPWFTGAVYPAAGKFFVQQMIKAIDDDVCAFDRMTFAGAAVVKFPEHKTAEEYIPVIEALSMRQIARIIGSVDHESIENFRAMFIEWLDEKGSKKYNTWLDAYASFYNENYPKNLIPKWWVSPKEFDDANLYERMKAA